MKLTGESVPDKEFGAAGRHVEWMLKQKGIPVQNGTGADIKEYGIEVKTRDKDSTSAQTVASMSIESILNTCYKDSVVFEKIQKQFRVTTKDNVIVEDMLYDFSAPFIQELIEDAYETSRKQMCKMQAEGYISDYVPGTHWGYFEKTKKDSASYSFRLGNGSFKQIESMATSTFNNIFEYGA